MVWRLSQSTCYRCVCCGVDTRLHTHEHMHTRTHEHTHEHTHTHVYICIWSDTQTCCWHSSTDTLSDLPPLSILSPHLHSSSLLVHTHTHTYIHTPTHAHTHTHLHTPTHITTQTYTHTYLHTPIHTYRGKWDLIIFFKLLVLRSTYIY